MKIPSRIGVIAGVTDGPPPAGRQQGRRRAIVAGLVAGGLVGSSLILPGVAAAAVPTAPDNLLVFANRDFVTVEGYQDHVGQTATVQVLRGTQVVGSAQGVVEAGDVAFEVNHPGGYCWGAGTGLNVTPDIKAGDKVTISFDGAVAADTTVQDAAVDTKATVDTVGDPTGKTVKIVGHVAAGVDQAQLEQRVVNPALTGTSVARRDIRAVPGPLVNSPKGGYSSGLQVSGTTATATYQFTGPDATDVAAAVARGGGERMMSWQVQDPAGNRQGMTIAELGEAGGPGMGGCPAGPGDQGAPTPGQATVVRSTDKTQLQVTWTPATPAPGAAAVTGYAVDVIAGAAGTEQGGVLKRLPATATSTSFTGLTAAETYTVEVRSLTGAKMSDPFTASAAGGTGTGTGTPNATFGKPTAGATAPVTLTNAADGAGADIYYTTDGSDPRFVDVPSATATRYTAPIAITAANTTLNFVAFKADGSFSDTGTAGPFQPSSAPTGPAAPTGVSAAPGPELAKVTWNAVTGATKYVVTATPPTGAPVVVEAGANALSIDVKPLVGNTTYAVTVAAANASGTGAASAPVNVTPTVNTTPQVSVSSAKWKARDFRVVGTTSAPAGTAVQVRTGSATGPVISSGAVTAGAVAGTNDFSVRDRSGNPPSNPGRIWVTVGTGSAGPITVANG